MSEGILVAVDVDGTLTISRGDIRLSVEGISAVRMLEDEGIPVSIVTGNALPVAYALAKYIGSTGPLIAENGCVVFYREREYHVCYGKPGEDVVEELKRLGLTYSWHNKFRFHEVAFTVEGGRDRAGALDLVSKAMEIANRHGLAAYWSGYALHIQPKGGGKARGLYMAASILGVSMDNVVAVGDGDNDIEMLRAAGFSACPSDASENVKLVVDYVARSPGGAGTLEIARHIVRAGDTAKLKATLSL